MATNVRTRLQALERERPTQDPRDMTTADIEAHLTAWLGHLPTESELLNLAHLTEDEAESYAARCSGK